MREEISAGGVVLFGNAILLLRKFNGDWVLPKGRVEEGEQRKDAALREVLEGFVDAKFIHLDRVVDLARYNDEREIIKVALEEIKKRNKKS